VELIQLLRLAEYWTQCGYLMKANDLRRQALERLYKIIVAEEGDQSKAIETVRIRYKELLRDARQDLDQPLPAS